MAVEVRRATAGDTPALVEMGCALHAESPQYRDEPFEPQVLRRWLEQRMGAGSLLVDDSAVFVAQSGDEIVGVLIGIVCDRWFNSLRFAAELTFYIKPERRGGRAFALLLHAYETWAAGQGASKATVGVSTGIHPDKTVHTYEKRGYKLDGHNATKAL